MAMLALACSDSSSPTAPLAAEPQMLLGPASANAIGDEVGDVAIFDFFATAIGEPEVRALEGEEYVRLEIGYRLTPSGPSTRAVLRFYGNLMSAGASLWKGADFFVTVKNDGKDGRDWYPAYRVLKCRMPDAS